MLANSGADDAMDGKNQWYSYNFTEPVFLNSIIVEQEEYSEIHDFEFKWTSSNGAENSQKLAQTDNGHYKASIDQLVKDVAFRPPKTYFTKRQITSVQLLGLKTEELGEYIRVIGQLDKYKQNIVSEASQEIQKAEKAKADKLAAKEDKEQLNQEILSLNQAVSNSNSEIDRLSERKQGLLDDISLRQMKIEKLDDKQTKIKEKIIEQTSESENLTKSVNELKQDLRSLEDDVNAFPAEIGGFNSQGAQNIRTYTLLSTVPILLIVLISGLLVFNAANLTTVYDEESSVRIWSILVTRLPFVIISMAIITASFSLARIFISEIMRINRQRLNLSKISIVATDISNSSKEGLNEVSELEIIELRTYLKMQLLRDHLKQDLTPDFKYKYKYNSENKLKRIDDDDMPEATKDLSQQE